MTRAVPFLNPDLELSFNGGFTMPDVPTSAPLDHEQVMEAMIRHAAAQMSADGLGAVLTDLLCQPSDPEAARRLSRVRQQLSERIRELVCDEILTADLHHRAKIARFGGTLPADEPAAPAPAFAGILEPAEIDDTGRCIAWRHRSGAIVPDRFLGIIDWKRSTGRELYRQKLPLPEGWSREGLRSFVAAMGTAEEAFPQAQDNRGRDEPTRQACRSTRDHEGACAEPTPDRAPASSAGGIAR